MDSINQPDWTLSLAQSAIDEIRKSIDEDADAVKDRALQKLGFQFRSAGQYLQAIKVYEILSLMNPKSGRYPRNIRQCRMEYSAAEGDFEACVESLKNVRAHDRSTVVRNCLINFVRAGNAELAERLLEHDVLKGNSSDGSRRMFETVQKLSKPDYLLELAKYRRKHGDDDGARQAILPAVAIIATPVEHGYLYGAPDGNSIVRLAFQLCEANTLIEIMLPMSKLAESYPFKIDCLAECLAQNGADGSIDRALETTDSYDAAALIAGSALGYSRIENHAAARNRVNQFLEFLIPSSGYEGPKTNGFRHVSGGFRPAAEAAFGIGDFQLRDKVIETYFEYLANSEYPDEYPFVMDLCLAVDAVEPARRAVAKMSWYDRQAESGRVAIKLRISDDEEDRALAVKILDELTAEVTHNRDSMFVNGAMEDHSWSRTMIARQWLEIGELQRAIAIKKLVVAAEQHKFLEYVGEKLAELRFFGDEPTKYLDWANGLQPVRTCSTLEKAYSLIGLHRGFSAK